MCQTKMSQTKMSQTDASDLAIMRQSLVYILDVCLFTQHQVPAILLSLTGALAH